MATRQTDSGITTGYEAELCAMADTLRCSTVVAVPRERQAQRARLDAGIAGNLWALGFGGES